MGFECFNGVDFCKGCYVGQEVIVWMKYKIELCKGFVKVIVEGLVDSGDEIIVNGKFVGMFYSCVGK